MATNSTANNNKTDTTDNTNVVYTYIAPVPRVKLSSDISLWLKSNAYDEYLAFLIYISNAVKCVSLTSQCSQSDGVTKLFQILLQLKQWVSEIPPHKQDQRFGNKAFRDWNARLQSNAKILLLELLPEQNKGAILELEPYFISSFGNQTRIDYGTGHEISFLIFILILTKLNVLSSTDAVAIVIKLFAVYMEVVRTLQTTYRLEPAGSHGVWGLDDYHFLPFIFGASQLVGNTHNLHPSCITDKSICSFYAHEFFFLECINSIYSVKTGIFAEHSSTLYGISSVSEWSKVLSGLIKMYKAEVLCKFPIIQHIHFGSLFSFEQKEVTNPIESASH